MTITSRWFQLFKIAKETREIAKETIPIITNIPFGNIQLEGYENLTYLFFKLYELIDSIILTNDVSFSEFAQNNYEFLDTLKTTLTQILSLSKQQPFPIIDEEKLEEAQTKIDALINELSSLPFTQQFKSRKLPQFFFDDRDPEELPESNFGVFISLNMF